MTPFKFKRSTPKGPGTGIASDTRGVSLLEGAILFPFLFTLGLGMFEFGNLLYQYQLVMSGVRDAARHLARVDITDATAETDAKNIAITGTVDGSGAARVSWWDAADITVTYPTTPNPIIDTNTGARAYRGGDNITEIRVTTTATYGSFGFLGYLGLGPISFTLEHRERHIGD
jgi:Flp pilus assembly protein TadG